MIAPSLCSPPITRYQSPVMREAVDVIAQLAVEVLRLRADVLGQRDELLVDALAQAVGALDARGVGAAQHVDHARARAAFLVRDADVAGARAAPPLERLRRSRRPRGR